MKRRDPNPHMRSKADRFSFWDYLLSVNESRFKYMHNQGGELYGPSTHSCALSIDHRGSSTKAP